jgi:hypothetical protein
MLLDKSLLCATMGAVVTDSRTNKGGAYNGHRETV